MVRMIWSLQVFKMDDCFLPWRTTLNCLPRLLAISSVFFFKLLVLFIVLGAQQSMLACSSAAVYRIGLRLAAAFHIVTLYQ